MAEDQKPLEGVLFELVGHYLSRRLESKFDITWKGAKESDGAKKEYGEKRAKIAKDAFLAVRARTGADFIDYFVSTLCSVPQHLPEQSFIHLSKQLYLDTDRVRTLTLLALSARS
jgi:CRISPR-associated protein Cmx8